MPRILLIEDNPGDAVLIEELLKDVSTLSYNYHLTHVERVSDAIKVLAENNDIDVILSDITLPDSRGVETLDLLTEATSELPILFMTGTNDEALAIKALKQGAQDYLLKGQATGEVLSRSLQYAIERKKSQNEMEKIKAREIINLERIKSLDLEKKQLIELNRSKDEFVSLASHQLRTPATAVKQYLGMIMQGFAGNDIDPKINQLVGAAYQSNERQLSVIEELLKTAQLDAPKIKLTFERIDLTQLINQVIINQLPLIEARSQTITFDDAKSYFVNVDKNEIRLVLENLIENASKYSANHTIISVDIYTKTDKVNVEVSDQGVGIKTDDQKKIFDKFTRIDNEMSDTVSGTGLGLYWAKRILKLHKGTITVTSEPKKGSVFKLTLPHNEK